MSQSITPSVTVREARASDTEFILNSIVELSEYEKLRHACVITAADLSNAFFGPNSKVFAHIAEIDGSPVGVAIFFYNFSTFVGRHGIYLEDLFVWPEFRGQGAGLALLKSLAQRAQKENLGRVEWSVLDWNEPAIQFYKKLLAQPQDEWTVFRLSEKEIASLANS